MSHPRPRLSEIRATMRAATLADESRAVRACVDAAGLTRSDRTSIAARAVDLVRTTRAHAGASIMQGFLAEYGLSTREGVALMCLAEALLRVPDTETIDALIEDKIGASDWGAHLGHSSSPLVNASTWALLLTGKVLGEAEEGVTGALHEAIRRLGEPVIRAAVAQAMRELGHQFVLGRDMREATTRAAAMEARGYTYSYDMLGEAARTEADARRYHLAYSASITALAGVGRGAGVRDRPGVSVKLSALHARYEFAQRDRVMSELVARLRSLALLAQSAGIGLNVDAEEAERLDLSLDGVEAMLADPALAGWEGFGVVVQAHGKRAPHVVDWLHELAGQLGRRIMVRLVKGAYWDTEVKRYIRNPLLPRGRIGLLDWQGDDTMATRSKGNGSRPAERLAAALKPTYDVEKVAEALQDCMDSAAERAVREVLPRLDKMDDTLRMIWKQCRGNPNQRLPIDD